MTKKSNADINRESLTRLWTYLETVSHVPARRGTANISAIALAAGVDRQVLYRDEAKTLVAPAVRMRSTVACMPCVAQTRRN